MPVMVVTRLRLKDGALLDEFFTDARRTRKRMVEAGGQNAT